jgi:hypothetical protein
MPFNEKVAKALRINELDDKCIKSEDISLVLASKCRRVPRRRDLSRSQQRIQTAIFDALETSSRFRGQALDAQRAGGVLVIHC